MSVFALTLAAFGVNIIAIVGLYKLCQWASRKWPPAEERGDGN